MVRDVENILVEFSAGDALVYIRVTRITGCFARALGSNNPINGAETREDCWGLIEHDIRSKMGRESLNLGHQRGRFGASMVRRLVLIRP